MPAVKHAVFLVEVGIMGVLSGEVRGTRAGADGMTMQDQSEATAAG